ncbi:MAG: trp operon repressor [Chlamydiota bacterium]|nr:trp operon repressor [Chlamydiota bacterium]
MNSDLDEGGWWQFLQLTANIQTAEEFDKFFTFFLTAEERCNLSKRYQLVKELLKGEKTQREIAHDHQISIAKITRGSNAIKLLDSHYRDWLQDQM